MCHDPPRLTWCRINHRRARGLNPWLLRCGFEMLESFHRAGQVLDRIQFQGRGVFLDRWLIPTGCRFVHALRQITCPARRRSFSRLAQPSCRAPCAYSALSIRENRVRLLIVESVCLSLQPVSQILFQLTLIGCRDHKLTHRRRRVIG